MPINVGALSLSGFVCAKCIRNCVLTKCIRLYEQKSANGELWINEPALHGSTYYFVSKEVPYCQFQKRAMIRSLIQISAFFRVRKSDKEKRRRGGARTISHRRLVDRRVLRNRRR